MILKLEGMIKYSLEDKTVSSHSEFFQASVNYTLKSRQVR